METIELLKIILSLILILFIPGLLWSYVFFKNKLDAIERLVLGSGLSIALVTLMILYLNRYLGIKVTFFNSIFAVIIICAIAVGILWKNKELRIHEFYSSVLSKRINVNISKNSIMLILIILLASYFNYIPHSNYDYPVHRDEWEHLTASKALIKAENTIYPNPRLGPEYKLDDLEIGFRLWISEILLTGISEWFVFKYLNILIACFTVLSVYIFAERFGYGLHAAFFTALIPTSVRLLGPGFLVPVSLAVGFIALAFFIAFRNHGSRYIPLFLIFLFLLYAHPPTALVLFIIFMPYIIAYREWKLAAVMITANIFALPQFLVMFTKRGLEAMQFPSYAFFDSLFIEYGYLPTIFCIIGTSLIHKRNEKDRFLVYSTVILLFLNYFYRNSGWSIFYPERNYFYIFILMSIIAGYGIAKLKDKRAIAVMVLLILFISYNAHIKMPYYYIIDDREFNDFVWIKNNLEGTTIIDPWKAIAFTAVAEKYVYSYVGAVPHKILDPRNREVYEFFRKNCSDIEFLKNNNLSIIYSRGKCDAPELKKVKDNIYYLEKG